MIQNIKFWKQCTFFIDIVWEYGVKKLRAQKTLHRYIVYEQ